MEESFIFLDVHLISVYAKKTDSGSATVCFAVNTSVLNEGKKASSRKKERKKKKEGEGGKTAAKQTYRMKYWRTDRNKSKNEIYIQPILK